MLVLSRKKGESIMIGNDIELVILSVDGDTIKMGITAPKEVEVFRKEVYLSIQETNKEASASKITLGKLNDLIRNIEKN